MTVAFMIAYPISLCLRVSVVKHPGKNSINAFHEPARVKNVIDVPGTERLLDIGIARNFVSERPTLIPNPHGIALDPSIRILTRNILRHESQKQFPRINQSVRQLEVVLH